jgi:hypothetical protein
MEKSCGDIKDVVPSPAAAPRHTVPTITQSAVMACARSWIINAALLLVLVHRVVAIWSPGSPAALRIQANVTLPDLYEASIAELQSGLDSGAFTSVDLVKAYFKRIEEVNEDRAKLHAVIETNPLALFEAQALDEERAFFGPRGPLHGIPVLVKDNIATIYGEGESSIRSYISSRNHVRRHEYYGRLLQSPRIRRPS